VKPKDPAAEHSEARRFGVTLAVVTSVMGSLSLWYGHAGRAWAFFGVGAVALIGALLFLPTWAVVFRLWMSVAMWIGHRLSDVVLTLIFYCVFTPAGILLRVLGKGPLDTAWKDAKPSYWRAKPERVATLDRYQKLY